MKLSLILSSLVIAVGALSACTSKSHHADGGAPRSPAQASEDSLYKDGFLTPYKDGKEWDASDPLLKDNKKLKYGDLTIWKLREMAVAKRDAELDLIFSHGLNMNRLPVGYSAGAGHPFPGFLGGLGPLHVVLNALTSGNWLGKIFMDSGNGNVSKGKNRIYNAYKFKVMPTASFTTYMFYPTDDQTVFDQPELKKDINSNFVVLNYADPVTGANYTIEPLLKVIPVFDVMVAVPGLYGPLYVGRTWKGKYDSVTKTFHADDVNDLIARYFLDFNPGALAEQEKNHNSFKYKETKVPVR